jgi:hypothetical protein
MNASRFFTKKIFCKHCALTFLFLFAFAFASPGQSKYCVDEIRELNLPQLPGKVLTYYSTGQEERAHELKSLLERASKFFEDSLKVQVDLVLAALDPKTWAGLMDRPYGLPTMRNGACKRGGSTFPEPRYAAIMPGGIDGPIYTSWIELKDSLPASAIQKLTDAGIAFGQGGKVLINFVALHELGHAYAHRFGLNFYVQFFAELIADYLAYAFLRSTDERLDKEVMAVLAVNAETIIPVHSSFNKYENFRSSEHPPTETWYNSVITLKAAEIYNQRGFEFLYAIQKVFTEKEGQLKTDTIIARLEKIHPGILVWSNNISDNVRKRK